MKQKLFTHQFILPSAALVLHVLMLQIKSNTCRTEFSVSHALHDMPWVSENPGCVQQNAGSSGLVGSIAKIVNTLSGAPSSLAQTSEPPVCQ